jgi:SAM-dependent methyltransferase
MGRASRRKAEPKPLKLNLACGQDIREGYENVDRAELPGVDRALDLELFPWPWESGSVAEIFCSHYVEHTADLIAFMDECWRVLKPGGTLTIIAPYYASMRSWQDPTHRRAISEATFLYFNKDWRAANKLEHYGIESDFDFAYGYAMTPEWANREESARAFAIRHYINVVDDIHVTLTKRA